MKVCTRCSQRKPTSEFYHQKDRKTGASACRACMNKMSTQRWVNIKFRAIDYKGGCCNHCGYNKFYGALEFHHLDPSCKDVSWNKLRLRSWGSITLELGKCILLCSNCHREEHHRLSS